LDWRRDLCGCEFRSHEIYDSLDRCLKNHHNCETRQSENSSLQLRLPVSFCILKI
jgi:hypothetical protein